MSDLCERIGRWAAAHQAGVAGVASVRRCVRDFAACTVAAASLPELAPALQLARSGGVRVWGMDQSFDPPSAALMCGVAGSLLQLHDLYAPAGLHPSVAVIPAALAASAGSRVSTSDFINAVAAGYEVANRIGDACSPDQARAGSTPTATAGAMGAAVTATLLQGGDAGAVARALSLVTMLAPVTPLAAVREHADFVPLHGGLAARAGVEAAMLVSHVGETRNVLEGDARTRGYLAVLQGRAEALLPEQWDGSTIDRVLGKRLPACFGAYGALEAVLAMQLPDWRHISEVRVGLPMRFLPIVELGPDAAHLYDRLMSARWTIARAIERRQLSWRDLEDTATTRELAMRVRLHHAPSLDALPSDLLAADVEVVSQGVLRSEWRRSLADPGIGTMRMDDAPAWREKFHQLTAQAPELEPSLAKLMGEH